MAERYGFPVQDPVTSEVGQKNFAAIALSDGTYLPQLTMGEADQISNIQITGIAAGAYAAGDVFGTGNTEVTIARGNGLSARISKPILEVSPAISSGTFRLEFYQSAVTGQTDNAPLSLAIATDKGKFSGCVRFQVGQGVGDFTRYVAEESILLKCASNSVKFFMVLVAETGVTLGASPAIYITLPVVRA